MRGKKVADAITTLSFTPNRAAGPIKKLIESAVASAKNNHDADAEGLFIKSIVVDEGFTMKRWMPKWRGTAHPIRKRTSHIKVVLDGEGLDKKEDKKEEKVEKKAEKKEEKKEDNKKDNK